MLFVIDRRDDGPWQPSYALSCICQNCMQQHVVILNRGEPATPTGQSCPFCEVAGKLAYGTALQASLLVKSSSTFKLVWEMQDGFVAFNVPYLESLTIDNCGLPRD
jgi:hypothetical protein